VKQSPGRRVSRFDKRLILAGILAAICLSPIGLAVGILALVSIIGIPIAIVIGAIPALFLIALVVRLVRLVMPVPGPAGWTLSAIAGLGLMTVPAYLANQRLEATAHSLVKEDQLVLPAPRRPDALAFIQDAGYRRDDVCGDFCQRALLNGIVRSFIAAHRNSPRIDPDSLSGTRFRFEQRAECPLIDVPDGIDPVELAGQQPAHDQAKPGDLIRLRIAAGDCLIAEPASVADADAVITHGSIRTGKSDYAAGFDIMADTVSAGRVAYFVRENGTLKEAFRETGVNYYPLLPVLTLSWIMGHGFDATPGFVRRSAYQGSAREYYTEPSLGSLIEKLGYDLVLRGGTTRELTRITISKALDGPQPVNRANAKVMADFFEAIGTTRSSSADDAELALRILDNRSVPIPRAASAPVNQFAAGNPDFAARFARIAFARLGEVDPSKREDHPTYLGYELTYLASAIEQLPDAAIRPYRAELEKLARNPAARVRGYPALRRLRVFGADAVPTLIWLIDDADRFTEVKQKQKRRDRDAWQHPYLAAIGGLCGMGPEGAVAIPALLERLESGKVVKFGSYWRQMVHTLIGLGADPEEIWPYLQTDDTNNTRERFDAEVKRAQRQVDCYY
jgi:hypothetical protein